MRRTRTRTHDPAASLADTGPVKARSPVQTALLLVGVIAIGVVAGILGLPSAGVVIFTAGVGTALFASDANTRRVAGAHAAAGGTIDGYPLQLPAERVAVGAKFQFRLLPPTRGVWAPGLLCVGPGEARFVPSRERDRSRAWAGPVDRSEILSMGPNAAVVRLHGRDGAAQFVLQRPPANLPEALPAWIAAPRGGSPPQ